MLYYFFVLIKDDSVLFYIFFLFCSNYIVNGCISYVYNFLTILRVETLVTKSYYFELIETIKQNNTNLQ